MDNLDKNYRWPMAAAALMLPFGFIIHPPLTAAGMREAIWIPDHAMLLVSLVLLLPGYALLIARSVRAQGLTKLMSAGSVLVYVALCSFIGVVYFELSVIPTLAHEAPHLLDHGLKVGALEWMLPLTGVTFVLGHWILGAAFWRGGMGRLSSLAMAVGAVGVGLKPILPTPVYITASIIFGLALVGLTFGFKAKQLETRPGSVPSIA